MWGEWRTTVWQRSREIVVHRECAVEGGRRNAGKKVSSKLPRPNLWKNRHSLKKKKKKKRRRRRRRIIANFQRKLQPKINVMARICNIFATPTSSHVSLTDFGKEEEKGGSSALPDSRELSRSSVNPDRTAPDGNIKRSQYEFDHSELFNYLHFSPNERHKKII